MSKRKLVREWQRNPLVIRLSGTAYVSVSVSPGHRRQHRLEELARFRRAIDDLAEECVLLAALGRWALERFSSQAPPVDLSQPISTWPDDARRLWDRLRTITNLAEMIDRGDAASAIEVALPLGMDVAETELRTFMEYSKAMAGCSMKVVEALASALAAAGARTVVDIAKELFERGEDWSHGPWRFEVDALGPKDNVDFLDPEGVPARELRTWQVVVGFGGKPARPVSLRTLEARCRGLKKN